MYANDSGFLRKIENKNFTFETTQTTRSTSTGSIKTKNNG